MQQMAGKDVENMYPSHNACGEFNCIAILESSYIASSAFFSKTRPTTNT
jgi:hypothetical protein